MKIGPTKQYFFVSFVGYVFFLLTVSTCASRNAEKQTVAPLKTPGKLAKDTQTENRSSPASTEKKTRASNSAYSNKNDFLVMTYNIRMPSEEDDAHGRGWDHRKENLLEMIHSFSPDIVGVQELINDKHAQPATWFRSAINRPETKSNNTYDVVRGSGKFANDIFVNNQRFKVLAPGKASESENGRYTEYGGCHAESKNATCTSERVNAWFLPPSYRSPCENAIEGLHNPHTVRTAVWTKLEDLQTNQKLFVVNAHLHHKHEKELDNQVRRQQLKCINRAVNQYSDGLPVIVLGDLNSKSTSSEFKAFSSGFGNRSQGFENTHDNKPDDGTWNGFCEDCNPNTKIDHILVRGLVPTKTSMPLEMKINGQWPSDHCPLLAWLQVTAPH